LSFSQNLIIDFCYVFIFRTASDRELRWPFSAAKAEIMGSILHFVTPNYLQAAFGPKNCDKKG